MTCIRIYRFWGPAESYLKPDILNLITVLFPFTTPVKSLGLWEDISEGCGTESHLGRTYGIDEGQRA